MTETLTPAARYEMVTMLGHLKRIVAEAGDDYVYIPRLVEANVWDAGVCVKVCNYVWLDQPDCLAGRVLHAMGVSVDILRQYEGNGCTAFKSQFWVKAYFEMSTLEVLRTAQIVQDQGQSWGVARDEALIGAREQYGVTIDEGLPDLGR